jgi:hypothetical protein
MDVVTVALLLAVWIVAVLVPADRSAAGHISETDDVAAGWSVVVVESTVSPDTTSPIDWVSVASPVFLIVAVTVPAVCALGTSTVVESTSKNED